MKRTLKRVLIFAMIGVVTIVWIALAIANRNAAIGSSKVSTEEYQLAPTTP